MESVPYSATAPQSLLHPSVLQVLYFDWLSFLTFTYEALHFKAL